MHKLSSRAVKVTVRQLCGVVSIKCELLSACQRGSGREFKGAARVYSSIPPPPPHVLCYLNTGCFSLVSTRFFHARQREATRLLGRVLGVVDGEPWSDGGSQKTGLLFDPLASCYSKQRRRACRP